MENNCGNIEDIQWEDVSTKEGINVRVVPTKFRHEKSDKMVMTFATLNTCSLVAFATQKHMDQLSISKISTFINIKTLTEH